MHAPALEIREGRGAGEEESGGTVSALSTGGGAVRWSEMQRRAASGAKIQSRDIGVERRNRGVVL